MMGVKSQHLAQMVRQAVFTAWASNSGRNLFHRPVRFEVDKQCRTFAELTAKHVDAATFKARFGDHTFTTR